jgi:hypothetical protein
MSLGVVTSFSKELLIQQLKFQIRCCASKIRKQDVLRNIFRWCGKLLKLSYNKLKHLNALQNYFRRCDSISNELLIQQLKFQIRCCASKILG